MNHRLFSLYCFQSPNHKKLYSGPFITCNTWVNSGSESVHIFCSINSLSPYFLIYLKGYIYIFYFVVWSYSFLTTTPCKLWANLQCLSEGQKVSHKTKYTFLRKHLHFISIIYLSSIYRLSIFICHQPIIYLSISSIIYHLSFPSLFPELNCKCVKSSTKWPSFLFFKQFKSSETE